MANETLARRYASAVFSLAKEANSVEAIGSELAMVARTIGSDPVTADFFISPVVARGDKESALTAAFRDRIGTIALHTLLLLVRKRREGLLGELVAEYRKLELADRGVEPLTLTTARELSEAEVRSTVEQLERIYGRKFEAVVHRDPKLIGGMRVAMGDRVIDGSVAGRLEELTRTLFSTP